MWTSAVRSAGVSALSVITDQTDLGRIKRVRQLKGEQQRHTALLCGTCMIRIIRLIRDWR